MGIIILFECNYGLLKTLGITFVVCKLTVREIAGRIVYTDRVDHVTGSIGCDHFFHHNLLFHSSTSRLRPLLSFVLFLVI